MYPINLFPRLLLRQQATHIRSSSIIWNLVAEIFLITNEVNSTSKKGRTQKFFEGGIFKNFGEGGYITQFTPWIHRLLTYKENGLNQYLLN